MENNPYIFNVLQTNGCRVWVNPNTENEKTLTKPDQFVEIYIKNLPKHMFEIDILPHFERFGPVYEFRLLIDYENCSRGFAFLIYFHEKSALECLDLMSYHIIAPGIMLEVERSQERSHLQVLNVPENLTDSEISNGFLNLYKELSKVYVQRDPSKSSCSAILEFRDHKTALNAKRWSGIGSVNMWGRAVKVLWAPADKVEELLTPKDEVKHVLVHNVPERFEVDQFGKLMCELVAVQEIINIRPMNRDWLLQFANQQAAYTIFTRFKGICIGNAVIDTEWAHSQRLKQIVKVADFTFELRCLCLANYWDPPIFIYSRILPFTKTQLCSVIIKNNRKNYYTTFFMEMCYDGLTEIHSRVCEALLLLFVEIKDLPTKHNVIKCSTNNAIIGKLSLKLSLYNINTPPISQLVQSLTWPTRK